MKFLAIFYFLLYVVHVFFSKGLLEFDGKLHMKHLFNRSLWLSYKTMLYIGFLIQYPSAELFIVTFLFSLTSVLGYSIKFLKKKVYYKQIFYHILVLFTPLIFVIMDNKINWKDIKLTYISLYSILYLLYLKFYDHELYKDGIDI